MLLITTIKIKTKQSEPSEGKTIKISIKDGYICIKSRLLNSKIDNRFSLSFSISIPHLANFIPSFISSSNSQYFFRNAKQNNCSTNALYKCVYVCGL